MRGRGKISPTCYKYECNSNSIDIYIDDITVTCSYNDKFKNIKSGNK